MDNTPVINKNGGIEVIEFFDYNCNKCKMDTRIFYNIAKKNNNIKLILKAIPSLGQRSIYATQIGHAIMFSEPEKYFDYFESLMNSFLGSEASIFKALNDSKIDVQKLKEILQNKNEEINNLIKSDVKMAYYFNIKGLPSIIINGELKPTKKAIKMLISISKK